MKRTCKFTAILFAILFTACSGSDGDGSQPGGIMLPDAPDTNSALFAPLNRPELAEQKKQADLVNSQFPRLAVSAPSGKVKVPIAPVEPAACSVEKRAADPCDGMDNDLDGIFDPCCCECVVGAAQGDVNKDGMLTNDDGACIFMVQFQKTVLRNNTKSCFDIDGNQLIEMNDVIAFGLLMQSTLASR